jgi:hypothetical protein
MGVHRGGQDLMVLGLILKSRYLSQAQKPEPSKPAAPAPAPEPVHEKPKRSTLHLKVKK